jgi:hypothetical protein
MVEDLNLRILEENAEIVLNSATNFTADLLFFNPLCKRQLQHYSFIEQTENNYDRRDLTKVISIQI